MRASSPRPMARSSRCPARFTTATVVGTLALTDPTSLAATPPVCTDALAPLELVLAAARQRDMSTEAVLDALLRMELVFRSSSRVKAGFAYRVESLSRARSG